MKGYKGTDESMKCRGMQYEVGKSYHADGTIELCHNGLHFCRNLHDVFDFYDPDNGSRYFEVVASGAIQIGADKCAASDLTIVRELSKAEVNRCTYGYGDGNGYVYGYGYGDGNGYVYGYGDGYGGGYGDGNGDGNGYGDGYGNGNSYGYGDIQKILLWRTLS